MSEPVKRCPLDGFNPCHKEACVLSLEGYQCCSIPGLAANMIDVLQRTDPNYGFR